jgi:hypothetical protein
MAFAGHKKDQLISAPMSIGLKPKRAFEYMNTCVAWRIVWNELQHVNRQLCHAGSHTPDTGFYQGQTAGTDPYS